MDEYMDLCRFNFWTLEFKVDLSWVFLDPTRRYVFNRPYPTSDEYEAIHDYVQFVKLK